MGDADGVRIVQTEHFSNWIMRLRDRNARLRIDDRLKRLAEGNPGDTKPLGGGVHELRLHFGPGYRIYFRWLGDVLIILLIGGDKTSQSNDVATAKRLAKEADYGLEGPSV